MLINQPCTCDSLQVKKSDVISIQFHICINEYSQPSQVDELDDNVSIARGSAAALFNSIK